MFCCDSKTVRDGFNISTQETEKGLRIDIEPKDPTKKKSLLGLVQGCKDFCNCGC